MSGLEAFLTVGASVLFALSHVPMVDLDRSDVPSCAFTILPAHEDTQKPRTHLDNY
jgi:hypothetical protein